ncbi:MAG: hypothetical protein R2705_19240 [Ilumatobacteraceae bacterium]
MAINRSICSSASRSNSCRSSTPSSTSAARRLDVASLAVVSGVRRSWETARSNEVRSSLAAESSAVSNV